MKQVVIFFLIFLIFHALSLIGYAAPWVSTTCYLLIVLSAAYLTWTNFKIGFLLLLFEFLAGHEGFLFSFQGLSLRLPLFLIIMIIWVVHQRGEWIKKITRLPISFYIFFLFLVVALGLGLLNGNAKLAIGDFINYSYLLLVFPLIDFLSIKENRSIFFQMISGVLGGLALLSFLNLFLFSRGLVAVHDFYYWWWRLVVVGKATMVGNDFYRIVTPSHILVLSMLLLFLSYWLHDRLVLGKKIIWPIVIATAILIINCSRGYFLGLAAGIIFLLWGTPWKAWLKKTLSFLAIFIVSSVLIFGLATRGKNFGLQFLLQRANTTINPEEELSARTRMDILPGIIKKIEERPFFGSGLGAQVTYQDSVSSRTKTTRHLDWGLLEMTTELGVLGLLSFIAFLATIAIKLYKKIKISELLEKKILLGLGAGTLAILVASLTGPFIFHALGLFFISCLAAYLYKEDNQNQYVTK